MFLTNCSYILQRNDICLKLRFHYIDYKTSQSQEPFIVEFSTEIHIELTVLVVVGGKVLLKGTYQHKFEV